MWSIWLVSCDCGFHSVFPLMDEDKRLVETSWWEELAVGKLGLALVGGAMLSKSLIQFSAGGWGCAPLCSMAWGQTMVGIMVPRAISFKMTYASMLWLPGLLESVPLTPRQATVNLHLHQRLPNTHRQIWLSLLWGHCAFFLGLDTHKVLFAPSNRLSP